jgi:hypothetical protein
MQINWEAAFEDLWSRTKKLGPYSGATDEFFRAEKQKFLENHTRRTEEDLPKRAWHWVRWPGYREWSLAYFNSGHDITYVFTSKGYSLNYAYYWEHRFELEIGPQVVPPGEEL